MLGPCSMHVWCALPLFGTPISQSLPLQEPWHGSQGHPWLPKVENPRCMQTVPRANVLFLHRALGFSQPLFNAKVPNQIACTQIRVSRHFNQPKGTGAQRHLQPDMGPMCANWFTQLHVCLGVVGFGCPKDLLLAPLRGKTLSFSFYPWHLWFVSVDSCMFSFLLHFITWVIWIWFHDLKRCK